MATRHLSRIIVMQSLYEWQFHNYPKEKSLEIFERNLSEFGQDIDEPEFGRELIKGIIDNLQEIDDILSHSIKSLPYNQVPLLEKSILRLATYEFLKHYPETPYKVIINEAIELAKNFGTKATSKFINGVLATVYENIVNLKQLK
ncbi:MAG: N utilization substance protein B [Candidatus Parcubacteria bacterium]|nr:MAG: N utilization substance protein B [Candidatus Parcubacteria bacterium]